MKFRKRPVTITARRAIVAEDIQTLEGTMRAEPGDWIITGIKGEQYPCKPDIFERTYEPADDDAVRAWGQAYPERDTTEEQDSPVEEASGESEN